MRYTEIAIASPFEGAPRINLPALYGASPKKPITLRIPVTGQRPITYGASNLPAGLTLNGGVITGQVDAEGFYTVMLTAENALGKAEQELTFEIKQDAVLLTPLMGFTSWNAFGPDVTQEKMEIVAKRMVDLGITEYGYSYINIDSGWQGQYGGTFDAVMPNYKFPNMKRFCDNIHTYGLKCGIYSAPTLRCWGCPTEFEYLPGTTCGEPDILFGDINGDVGTIRKEKNNALQWADWGFDYLKYDWVPTDTYNAEVMRRELVATDRDFGLSITTRAHPDFHNYWQTYINSYRNNGDSHGSWENLLEIYRSYFDFATYMSKGHFFDLDMLDIGTCELFLSPGKKSSTFSEDEQIVAFSMRAFLSSPIQISSTLEHAGEFELSLYCNEEILAINQDCGFHTVKPHLMLENGNQLVHCFRKKLADGSYAFAYFNLGETTEDAAIFLDDAASVRDLWAKKDLGVMDTISFKSMPRTVRIFKVSAP